MRQRDLGSALFLLVFGLLVAFEAHGLSLGTPGRPGPGFFPFSLATLLCLIGVALIIQAARGERDGRRPEAAEAPEPLVWTRILLALASLLMYAFLLEILGFLLTTTLLMLFLFRAVEPQRWAVAVGGSIATAAGAYLLFKTFLKVQLPPGVSPW